MHTTLSDGTAHVTEVLNHIERFTNLDVIAITDHDRIEASLWAYEHRARWRFDVVPGMEVTTRGGHVLALWVMQTIPPHMSLEETVAAVHEQGGMAILAHPLEILIDPAAAWRYFCTPSVLLQARVDAVEVFNAGSLTPGMNAAARARLRRLGIPFTGNSDAHLPESIGSGYTRFCGKSAADLRQSLRHGWTAAEGERWQLTTYLKLLHTAIQWKRSRSSRAKHPFVPQMTP
jgi:predicted metal-dependent phosphoesterase TrpH